MAGMKHTRQRVARLLALSAALVGGFSAGATAADPAATDDTDKGTVVVEVRKIRHGRGHVRVALWRTGDGFPTEGKNAFAGLVVGIQRGTARAEFTGVPPGRFAVVVHHDEDDDGEMDTNFFGVPTEGFGTSRDAPARFGPPSYRDARMRLKPGERKRVVIEMRY